MDYSVKKYLPDSPECLAEVSFPLACHDLYLLETSPEWANLEAFLDNLKKGENMDDFKELEMMTAPLVQYLKQKLNPHCAIIVTTDFVKIVSDSIHIPLVESGQPED